MKGCCLRRVAPDMNEHRSRSGLCERVIRREATETEGLVKMESVITEVTSIGYLSFVLEYVVKYKLKS